MINPIPIIPNTLGKLITTTPPDPAAGTNGSFLVPIHTVILPVYLEFTFTADANAASRRPGIAGFDGSDEIFRSYSPHFMTANQVKLIYGSINIPYIDFGVAGSIEGLPMSSHQYLRFGDSMITIISSMQVGDQISDILLRYMQWIQE